MVAVDAARLNGFAAALLVDIQLLLAHVINININKHSFAQFT